MPAKSLVNRLPPSMATPVNVSPAEDKLPLTGKAFHLAFGQSSLFASSFDKVQKKRESLAMELNGRLLERENINYAKIVDSIMERIYEIMGKGSIDCRKASQQMAFTMLGATIFGDAFLAWSQASIYEEL
ncbi:hypothetical protein Ddye_029725 [Dipteronia dyeriana]|uniref:Uncharacterized protein n=1 Tax=Dipteronia dyeriana TaxID=168575 RepID=A0AAD9TFN7_9ROSI|nr:hypothetical protein Ddye_029725 [Dipteronia dyeriana]